MKIKGLLWILVMVLLATASFAAVGTVQVQISLDNITWIDVNSSAYEGSIDETNNIATGTLLAEEKCYYARLKDDVSDWRYLEFCTRGFNMMFGVLIVLSLLVVFFLYLFASADSTTIGYLRASYFLLAFIFALADLWLLASMGATFGLSAGITGLLYKLFYVFGLIFFVVFMLVVLEFMRHVFSYWKAKRDRDEGRVF